MRNSHEMTTLPQSYWKLLPFDWQHHTLVCPACQEKIPKWGGGMKFADGPVGATGDGLWVWRTAGCRPYTRPQKYAHTFRRDRCPQRPVPYPRASRLFFKPQTVWKYAGGLPSAPTWPGGELSCNASGRLPCFHQTLLGG